MAIKYLNLQPEDRLADVAGGTGGVAEIIHKRVGEYLRRTFHSCLIPYNVTHKHFDFELSQNTW